MSAEEGEELLQREGRPTAALSRRSSHQVSSAALGILCVLGCFAATVVARSVAGAAGTYLASPVVRPPLTVRALLESRELAEVATDNLIALSQALGENASATLDRQALRDHVSRRFLNISSAIRRQDPDAHQQLGALQLSAAQKDSVLRVLRLYGDARMVRLTNDITTAVREAMQQGGDSAYLRRHLEEKLEPRLGELRQLSEEEFPGVGARFALDVERLHLVRQFDEWRPAAGEDLGTATTQSRRLASTMGADGGVQAQAATLFQALQGQLGERMPTAPARMLSFGFLEDDEASSGTPADGGAQGHKKVGFMSCVMAAVPNPIKVCECMAQNIQEVIKMLMEFVNGKSRH